VHSATLLSVEELSISFRDASDHAPREILSCVNFRLEEDQILALVGASGSGKSLTSLAIGQLLPPRAIVSGKIFFEGVDLLQLPKKQMCQLRGSKIAYVFQEPMACFNPILRIGNQAAECMCIKNKHLSRREAHSHILNWFERVNLSDGERIFRSYPHELSGGMLQRVMLVMALCNGPRLLIADEPTSALDGRSQNAVIELIRSMRWNLHFSILFITHDENLARNFADSVFHIKMS
jgi:ABC-type glutathione transport system ATPase component